VKFCDHGLGRPPSSSMLVISCTQGARPPYRLVYAASSRKPPESRQNRYEFSRRPGDRVVAHRRRGQELDGGPEEAPWPDEGRRSSQAARVRDGLRLTRRTGDSRGPGDLTAMDLTFGTGACRCPPRTVSSGRPSTLAHASRALRWRRAPNLPVATPWQPSRGARPMAVPQLARPGRTFPRYAVSTGTPPCSVLPGGAATWWPPSHRARGVRPLRTLSRPGHSGERYLVDGYKHV